VAKISGSPRRHSAEFQLDTQEETPAVHRQFLLYRSEEGKGERKPEPEMEFRMEAIGKLGAFMRLPLGYPEI
jgi:hypothetical protein